MLHDAVVESAAGDTARQLAQLHGGPLGAGAADVARATALLDECLAASSASEAAERASSLLGGPPLGPAGTQQGLFLVPPGFEPPPYSQTIPLSFDLEPPQDVRKLSEQSAMNDENLLPGAARRDERGIFFNACSTLDKYRRRRLGREEEADRRNDPSLDATLDPQADDDDDL